MGGCEPSAGWKCAFPPESPTPFEKPQPCGGCQRRFSPHPTLLQNPQPRRKSAGAQQAFALVSEVWLHSRLSLHLCEGDDERMRPDWESHGFSLAPDLTPFLVIVIRMALPGRPLLPCLLCVFARQPPPNCFAFVFINIPYFATAIWILMNLGSGPVATSLPVPNV